MWSNPTEHIIVRKDNKSRIVMGNVLRYITVKQCSKQESPPAWTQEAYRPQRIKYSISFPRWGTLPSNCTPSQAWWGVPEVGYPQAEVPPSQVWWGYPNWSTPWQGYPPARSDESTQGGVPLARSDRGYLRWGTPWEGTPSQVWWGGYPAGWTWLGYHPPSWTWPGYPLWTDRMMDGQTRVKTLPSSRTAYAVGNNAHFILE